MMIICRGKGAVWPCDFSVMRAIFFVMKFTACTTP
jgi:hypothetical protein